MSIIKDPTTCVTGVEMPTVIGNRYDIENRDDVFCTTWLPIGHQWVCICTCTTRKLCEVRVDSSSIVVDV